MNEEYQIDPKKHPALKKVIKKIKAKKPKNLDYQFEEAHDEIFEKIDCLQCANCCKTTSPMFFEKDIDRLAKFLRMRTTAFIEQYLERDTDGIYALKSTPCTFLGSDNYCTVYDARPKACREFPHTNHRKMIGKMNLAEKNLEVCPAVNLIIEKIGEGLK